MSRTLLLTDRRLPLALAGLTAIWAVGLELGDVGPALLYLAPALLIAIPLLLGRYPGERLLCRAMARRTKRPRRRVPVLLPACLFETSALLPRGGRLVGAALARRGPPLPAGARARLRPGRSPPTFHHSRGAVQR